MTQKVLVLYHFYPAGPEYEVNLEHFIQFGLSPDVDFVFLNAGEDSLRLPAQSNLREIKVANLGLDFGGYSEFINKNESFVRKYDFIIFLNSSVRGPYLAGHDEVSWVYKFTSRLQGDVWLSGPSFNMGKDPRIKSGDRSANSNFHGHLQSFAFALKSETLASLIESGFFPSDGFGSKMQIIDRFEVGLSRWVFEHKKAISCWCPPRVYYSMPSPSEDNNWGVAIDGDMNYFGSLVGRTPSPYEMIFVKTNRGAYLESYLHSLSQSQEDVLSEATPIRSNAKIWRERPRFYLSFRLKRAVASKLFRIINTHFFMCNR